MRTEGQARLLVLPCGCSWELAFGFEHVRTMSTLHVKASARMLGARSLRGTSARRCIMVLRHASAVRGLNWLYNSWACLGTTAKPKPSPRAALVLPPSILLEAVDRSPAGRASRSAATHATANTCQSRMVRLRVSFVGAPWTATRARERSDKGK